MISNNTLKLILDYEVGGGEEYYNKFLKHPTWPGGASGVTIGVGYDLGYESMNAWKQLLQVQTYERLLDMRGLVGERAKIAVKRVKDITIPWSDALDVFEGYTIANEERKTISTFPGVENLHPDVFGALISLVFNRGTSLLGERRKEMRAIRECVKRGDVQGIADNLYAMKWLWPDVKGLRRRRDAEAALVLSTLEGKEI